MLFRLTVILILALIAAYLYYDTVEQFTPASGSLTFSTQDSDSVKGISETTYQPLLHDMATRARAINSVGIPVLETYAGEPTRNYLSQSLMLYGAKGAYSDVGAPIIEERPYSRTFGSVESYLNFEPDHVVLTG